MDITNIRSDKVNDQQVANTQNGGKTGTASDVKGDKSDKSVSSKGHDYDKVKFSPEAAMALEGIQASRASPDVRADRVQALKAAIKSGTYKMDPQQVADKMIQSSLEEDLLTRKS